MPDRICCMATILDAEPAPLLVGREDGTLEKYISAKDADLNRPSLYLYGHTKSITGLSARSGEEVWSCSLDGTLRMWNTERMPPYTPENSLLISCIQLNSPARCLALSTGPFIYVGCDDGAVRAVRGRKVQRWQGHHDLISCMVLSEDNNLLVTGSYDNQIRLWDVMAGTTTFLLMGHTNPIKSLHLVFKDEEEGEEGGYALLSFASDRTMKIWDLNPPPAQGIGLEDEDGSAIGDDDQPRNVVVSFKEPRDEPKEAGENLEDRIEREDNDSTQDTTAAKSALKVKKDPPLPIRKALGTIELPESPHTLVPINPETPTIILVGATEGNILGIRSRVITKTILRFAATNAYNVRKEIRDVQKLLKQRTRALRKECDKAIRNKKKTLVTAAKKVLQEKKRKEREEKAAAAKLRAAERAQMREEMGSDEEDEMEEEEEQGEEEFPAEEEEDLEQEEEEEDGEEGAREMIPSHLLSDEQKEELATFKKEKETERDDKIKKLKNATDGRISQVSVLAHSTYDTKRDAFHSLSYTFSARAGKQAVISLCAVGDDVYASQGGAVVKVNVKSGLVHV